MQTIKELFQSADWKTEKHIPVIDIQERVKKGQSFDLRVSVGKEIVHPNTIEHHISWIEIYFLPQGEKYPCQIGRFEFSSHGGTNTGAVFTHPSAAISFKTDKPGILFASSYCNIHGLWESSRQVDVDI